MNVDPAKFSLSNFLGGESDDPLQPPQSFTNWMQLGAWAVELYEPELLSTADARTTINYAGKPRQVINLCSYNYLGLANHPGVLAAAHEADVGDRRRVHSGGPRTTRPAQDKHVEDELRARIRLDELAAPIEPLEEGRAFSLRQVRRLSINVTNLRPIEQANRRARLFIKV